MSISNLNITYAGYNTLPTSSGFLLVESIQTLKYYLNNIGLNASFYTNVDFSGLYYPQGDGNLTMPVEQYYSELKMNDVQLSVSQKFTVDDLGDIQVELPSLSLSLQPENVNLTFPGRQCDFSATIQRVFNNLRNYFLYNSNSLIQDNKDLLTKIHEDFAMFFTEIRLSYNNYTLFTKYLKREDISTNPIINSNYISAIQTVNIKDPSGASTTITEEAYLPIVDQSGLHMQVIISQGLLQQIIKIVWTSTSFLNYNNPTLRINFISFTKDSSGNQVPEQCTIQILEGLFPGITAEYGTNVSCNVTVQLREIKNFTINTGRIYSTNNTISWINFTLFNNETGAYIQSIIFVMPVDTLYINLKLNNDRVRYQIYNIQPSYFALIYPFFPKFNWNSDTMMDYWNNEFKAPSIRYFNQLDDQNQGFPIESYMYSWLNPDLVASFNKFQLELYDKFIIMNFEPDYKGQSIINVIQNYVIGNLHYKKGSQGFDISSGSYKASEDQKTTTDAFGDLIKNLVAQSIIQGVAQQLLKQ